MIARFLFAGLLLAAFGMTGCSTLGRPAAQVTPDVPTCVVEFRPLIGKPREVTIPLEKDKTVQTALEESGAIKSFRRMDVAVNRRLSATDPLPQTFRIPYDRGKKKVSMLHDYALKPGDQIVVIENNGNVVGDMLQEVTAPVRGMLGDHSK